MPEKCVVSGHNNVRKKKRKVLSGETGDLLMNLLSYLASFLSLNERLDHRSC